MRRIDAPMVALLVILIVVLAGIVAVLRWQSVTRLGEIQDLREQLAAAQSDEPQEGGAETALPPAQPVRSAADSEADVAWLFPIAERDFRRYTSPVGARISPIDGVWKDHQGVDISTVWRAEVVAAADGEVVDHWPVGTYGGRDYDGHELYGGYVEILHDNGWRTRYGHLDSTRVDLFRIGVRIAAGTPLGRVGNTGQSVRDHLHFEMIDPNGTRVNPLGYVEARRTEGQENAD
ncbi:MAG: M23 family metallopeptidase [Spirochaetota bacterium]